MGLTKYDTEISHREHHQRRVQVVFTRTMEERKIFMEELRCVRNQREKRILQQIRTEIGPRWYHALSVMQRRALDTLKASIYQDLLEGRPSCTFRIIRILGIYPRPKKTDLMDCVYEGRHDHKLVLVHLFFLTFGVPIDEIVMSYSLNAKLMLSAIYYLGLNDMICWLREKFKPDPVEPTPKPKIKPKVEPPLKSPYLQKMVAALYMPKQPQRLPPPPLPANLEELNEPYEEKPMPRKPDPPPPPPPPPKVRIPISYCDKLAGVVRLEPYRAMPSLPLPNRRPTTCHRKLKSSKSSKMLLTEGKKSYGMASTREKKIKKPVAPSTGMWNAQYLIMGVYVIHQKSVFVLGSVTMLVSEGEIIHGGHRFMANGEYINIHCGTRANSPSPPDTPCDCVKKYHDAVISYVQSSKCRCGHFYDFGHEGPFSSEEPPFFTKPDRTGTSPFAFNHSTIYELNPKVAHVEKEFKKAFDTDSMLREGGPLPSKKKKKRRSSSTCLGENPRPEDYLRCALRLLRSSNISARLPEVHIAPELKEWMRKRIYGPLNHVQKRELLDKSGVYWTILKSVESKGFGHTFPTQEPEYMGCSDWAHKERLLQKFKIFTKQYRLKMFKAHAELNNMLWATMFQAQIPDRNFRQIYFSYLNARFEDLYLMHPYSAREAVERMIVMAKNQYCCIPDGVYDDQ